MENSVIIIVLTINSILAHAVGKSGEVRKIGYIASFISSFFFTPIIGLLFVISSKNLSNEEIRLESEKNHFIFFSIFANILVIVYFFLHDTFN